jgi:putative hydrolase of the HAD superfamily
MIRHILFDLDDTLYSANYGLDDRFLERLQEFTSTFLGMDRDECESLRREAITRYGTTLEWLCVEKGFTDTEGYFAFIHPENEADCLPPNPELRQFLMNLPCPCSVLTNSPRFHAERVIKKIGLEGVFLNVFDIASNGLKGKPHESAFRAALGILGLEAEEALFVDDYPRYVYGYILIGGKGLLFDENDTHKNYPYEKIRELREITRFLV